jgi:hypothetical protein
MGGVDEMDIFLGILLRRSDGRRFLVRGFIGFLVHSGRLGFYSVGSYICMLVLKMSRTRTYRRFRRFLDGGGGLYAHSIRK